MVLGVHVQNPNAFSMIINRTKYNLEINGLRWVSGDFRNTGRITEKSESRIEIPFTLNFLQMGQSVYQMLKGDSKLDYKFSGNLILGTNFPLLEKVDFPFNKSGIINVNR